MYPRDYLVNLQSLFLGLISSGNANQQNNTATSGMEQAPTQQKKKNEDEDIDGKPLVHYDDDDDDETQSGDDLDGKPRNQAFFFIQCILSWLDGL